MDLMKLTAALEAVTRQTWLSGIKAGLAVVACVFIYLEAQARFVTADTRKKVLKWTPGVLGIAGILLTVGAHLGGSYKLFAPLRETAVPIFAVFACAAGLLALGVNGIEGGVVRERVKQIIGGVLALVAILLFFLCFHLSFKSYYHRWELFHYYMGSKYAKELSYERIYVCAAIADAETGNEKDAKRRKMRDLRVNLLTPTKAILEHPEECKSHFTPERWEDFKRDLIFFRKASGRQYWNDMQKDHGYNPPPIWTIAGHYLSILQPANDAYFKLLSAIDVVLTALLFIAIGWAFGWRAAVIGAIFWGTQEPAPFYWTGGAFLRQDWFFLAVLSACLARKRYYFWAGAALAYSAGLRVFPVLLWGGPLIIIGWHVWKHRRLDGRHARFLAGGAVAGVVLFLLSLHVVGGFNLTKVKLYEKNGEPVTMTLPAGMQAWAEFAHHIGVHKGTALTNNMGMDTVLKSAPEGRMKYTRDNRLLDPFERWKDARKMRGEKLKWVKYGLLAVFAGLMVWTLREIKSLWVGMGLSLLFVMGAVETTCYYFSIWILGAVLTKAKRQMEWPLLAVFFGVFMFVAYKLLATRMQVSELVALAIAVGGMGLIYWYNQDSLLAFARSRGSMEIAVIGLGGASQLLTVQFYFIDDKFVAISALYLAWTIAFVLAFVRKPEPQVVVEPIPVRSSA